MITFKFVKLHRDLMVKAGAKVSEFKSQLITVYLQTIMWCSVALLINN